MSLRRVLSVVAIGVTIAILTGCSNNSNAPTAANLPTDNSAPAAPVVSGMHSSQIDGGDVLTWLASASPNVSGYEVYMYSPDPSRDNSYILLGQTRPNITRFVLPVAEGGETQYFQIKAYTATGAKSAASATFSAVRNNMAGGGSNRDQGRGQHEGTE